MKFLRNFGLAGILLSAVFTAAAQAIGTTVTTIGGLTLTYPEHFTGYEPDPQTFVMIDEQAGLEITVDFEMPMDGISTSAEEAINTIADAHEYLDIVVGREQMMGLELENGTGFQMPITVQETSILTLTFNLADNGVLVYLEAMRLDAQPFSIQEQDALLEILRSVSVDLDIADAYFQNVLEDVPANARYIDDMPNGVLQFSNGFELDIVEGWSLHSETPYVQDSAVLLTGGDIYTHTGIISVLNYESTQLSYNEYRNTMLTMTALMFTGNNDFSAERDIISETLENGYILEYLRLDDTVAASGNHYILRVNDAHWFHFIVTTFDEANAQEIIEQAEEIVKSVREFEVDHTEYLFDTLIGIDPTAVTVVNADCYKTSEATEDEFVFYYQCPAGCANNGGRVWGTDIYSDDSAVCVSAIHAGIVTNEAGGDVIILWEPAQDEYISTTQNNVTTLSYGYWRGSYTLVPVPDFWWE